MGRAGRAFAPRRAALGLSLGAGLWVAALKACSFVPAFRNAPRPQRPAMISLRAEGEGEKEGEGDGFLKFLKVEQDIELSPEEYQMALEAETEEQRKRFYINGVVKAGNLIVPWKGIDEKALVKDARRRLRKNGIKDPSGEAAFEEDEEDSEIALQLIGSQDVVIEWAAGVPGQKVGYIVERKRTDESNFEEIASYEAQQNAYLLSKPYAGHEYEYTDQIVKPGTWTYRILVRLRTGEVSVVDAKDIIVPEPSGVDNQIAGIAFLIIFGGSLLVGFFADPAVK